MVFVAVDNVVGTLRCFGFCFFNVGSDVLPERHIKFVSSALVSFPSLTQVGDLAKHLKAEGATPTHRPPFLCALLKKIFLG